MATQIPAPANPIEALLRMGSGLWVSRALWAAAKLKLADAIGDEGRSVGEIAAEVGARPDMLGRLLHALASVDLFEIQADGRVAQSELSRFLRSDHPLSQRALVESIFGGEHYAAWGAFEASLRTGVPAFDHHYGEPVFAYFSTHPEVADLFSQAMTSTTRLMEAALFATYTPPAFTRAVDLGGSQGTLVAGFLAQRPEATGVLFDLPELVEQVRPTLTDPRVEAVGGDFFKSVPEGDLYFLKQILHDWSDDQSIAILKNVRKAIRPGGHVAIIEQVLPDPVAPSPGYLMDLNMMVMTSGRERTAAEYDHLLSEAGFTPLRVVATPGMLSVVEAHA